jgi:hypothetical protein
MSFDCDVGPEDELVVVQGDHYIEVDATQVRRRATNISRHDVPSSVGRAFAMR